MIALAVDVAVDHAVLRASEGSEFMRKDIPRIAVDQLQIGMYVDIELGWLEHPFAFSHFRITAAEQIATIRSLGLKTVRYHPALSDVGPPPRTALPPAPTTDAPPDLAPALDAEGAKVEPIIEQAATAGRIQNAFVQSAQSIRDIEKNLLSQPTETVRQATQLVTQVAESILCAPELAIHVMGDKKHGDDLHFHALNVTILSLIMAREIGLPLEGAAALGMGALFHDIGRKQIPSSILRKAPALTAAEQQIYEMHCQYGFEIGQRLQLAPAVLAIIRTHHECFDGTGYPARLKGESIGLFGRIVAIANHYDELCNPANTVDALTPHEALSVMFAKLRSKFDPVLLKVFIRCLGVYPPGTIVQLSNGVTGMVATVNTAQPMKPMILTYDANIPKHQAILVDLARATQLNIARPIRPVQVPVEVHNYLSTRKRVSYYFDAGQPGQDDAAT